MISKQNSLFHITAYQFNPESLKIAREYRGYKKNELAAKLNLTPSAITQFEKGEVKPNSQTIAQLCLALNFPASFFSQSFDSSLIAHEQCHFRSLMSCSQIERRRMVAAGNLIGRIVKFVDEHIELPPEQVSNSISYGRETLNEIEEAAEKVRRDWGLGLGPIDNVIHLLEAKGILVFRLLEESKKLDAFSLWQGKRPFVFLNSEKGSASRSRYDASHELGHLILHSEYLPGNKFQELQANQFASAFLMPRDTFLKECPRRLVWNHFLELKQRWKVSLAALVRRAKDLKILSEDTYKRANVQIQKNGWKYNEPSEPEIEMPTILPQAVGLLNESNLSLSHIADELSISESDLQWLIFMDTENKNETVESEEEISHRIQFSIPKQNLIEFPLDRSR
jgi:Zn-dependent peptidase ImmA (M78 family)/DNA-binding XRE family transcriptional regulator